jgi:6-pyruvoyltetrahydropterin/6-carboxytetrahydropterin synthase
VSLTNTPPHVGPVLQRSTSLELIKTFTFDAAHRLTTVPAGHKCARLHGHTFKVEIHLSGQFDPASGYLVDFAEVKQICTPVIDRLDHTYLNDIEGLENPTSENIAIWLWNSRSPSLRALKVAWSMQETVGQALLGVSRFDSDDYR